MFLLRISAPSFHEMSAQTEAHAVSRKEADAVRAARGFRSFKEWQSENRKAARLHRAQGIHELANALDRELARYIRGNV